jgi:short-subunit dehydrogenase
MNLVIITGAKKGLGKSLSELFRINGWEVRALKYLAHEIGLPYGSIDKPYERVVFINNGFRMVISKASELDKHTVDRNILLNINNPINLFTSLLRDYPNAEIVNITSGAATRGIAYWSLYCAGKAAMEGFLRALEAEEKVSNV